MNKFQPLALTLSLLLAAPALLAAEQDKTATISEQVKLEKSAKHTKIVLVQDGETEEFNWSSDELQNEAMLEQALSKVPEEKRERIKKLLMDHKDGHRKMIFHAADGAEGDMNIIDRKMIVKTLDGKNEFDVIKQLLQNANLNKDQLLELQKLLDSKH
jgi:hypothetical protein